VIRVVRGRLEEAAAEAVARPVGTDGEAIDAPGRRIELAAGEAMSVRLQRMGEMPLGGAFLTPGGELAARFVLHLVVRSPEEPVTRHTVQRALVNALARAHDWDLASLAVPPLGLGAGNLESEAAAELMVAVLQDHLDQGRSPSELLVVVESDYDQAVFTQALERGVTPDLGEGR
jgi:serine/threonine-protein kinase